MQEVGGMERQYLKVGNGKFEMQSEFLVDWWTVRSLSVVHADASIQDLLDREPASEEGQYREMFQVERGRK